eukprot:5642344-Karenia_brevis.AAC.1
MDLLSGFPAALEKEGDLDSQAGEASAKRRGTLSRAQQKLEDLVKTSIKLNLYCSQQVRTLRAITIWSIRM